jgi:hypothetical protein
VLQVIVTYYKTIKTFRSLTPYSVCKAATWPSPFFPCPGFIHREGGTSVKTKIGMSYACDAQLTGTQKLYALTYMIYLSSRN